MLFFKSGCKSTANFWITQIFSQKNHFFLKKIANIDISIVCQRPKLLKYKEDMKKVLVDLLKIDADKINIKANTNEGMDAIGKGLAIASYANVLIYK